MAHVPTYCDVCSRTTLHASGSIQDGTTPCAECGARARIVPGSSYAPEDVLLYDELAAAIRESGIRPLNAGRLLVQVGRPHRDTPGLLLKRLSRTLPSLAVLELSFKNDARTLRKAESMLSTILDAISNGRGHSGVLPAMTAADATRPLKTSNTR